MNPQVSEIKECISKIKGDLSKIESSAKEIITYTEKGGLIPDNLKDDMIFHLEDHIRSKNKCLELLNEYNLLDKKIETVGDVEERIQRYEKDSTHRMVAMFYDLHSDNNEIELILEKEKKKLDAILNENEDAHFIEDMVKDYVDFADAVNTINTSTPAETLTIMQRMMGTFGSDLTMHAFVVKDIYVGKKDESAEQLNLDSSEKIIDEKTIEEDERNINKVNVDPDEKSIEEGSETEIASDSIMTGIQSAENLLDYFLKYNAIIPADFDMGLVHTEISTKENGKTGASKFRNEINSMIFPEAARQLLKITIEDGVISCEYLDDKEKGMSSSKPFSQLVNKGYIRKYNVIGKGGFYCASPKLLRALKAKDVCDYLKLRNYDRKDMPTILDPDLSIILCRLGYSRLYGELVKYLEGKRYTKHRSFLSEVCIGRFLSDEIDEMIIVITKSDETEMSELEECINIVLSFDSVPKHYVIASVNLDYAEKYAVSFVEYYGFDIDKVFIYQIGDGKLYTLENNEELSFDQLWATSVDTINIEDSRESDIDYDEEKAEVEVDRNQNVAEIRNDKEVCSETEKSKSDTIDFNEKDNLCLSPTVDEKHSDHVDNSRNTVTPSKEESAEKINVEEILSHVYEMINDDKLYCALSYLRSFTDQGRDIYDLWRTFAYAANDPLKACRYSSSKMYDVYMQEETKLRDYLFCSAVLRTFFYNNLEYDYLMMQLYEGNVQNIKPLDDCVELKNAFHIVVKFKDEIHKGINEYADYKMQDNVNLEKKIGEVQRRAELFYEERVVGKIKESTKQERFVKTKRDIFSTDNEIGYYLKAVVDGNKELNSDIREYLSVTFLKESSEANIVNLDSVKMDLFIDEAWEKVGKTMPLEKKSNKLIGSLRGNLRKNICTAIEILCDWLSYSSIFRSGEDDKGIQRYKQVKNTLHNSFMEAKQYFEKELETLEKNEEEAGCRILILTIDEMLRRLDGRYSEEEYKYFYIDFLKADLVLLDEDYLPVMDLDRVSLEGLSTAERILDHSTMELGTFEERLEDIFLHQGDDFGSAKLIINYLGERGDDLVRKNNYDIEASIAYGRRGAQKNRQEFIENLELMQSYGLIDNTVENTKDKFLQISNRMFDFCYENNNFGFYKSVIDSIIENTKKEAKKYEKNLTEELHTYRSTIEEEDESESILERLDMVQEMLDNQNYTVAQDLLARIKRGDLDVERDILPEDYLELFISQYDQILSKTADSSKNLINVVSNKLKNAKNKDTNAGKRLIDNWPKTGFSLDSNRLNTLLSLLGFNVESIIKAERIGKIDNYNIKLAKPLNGRKVNYKHPIAAFGSIAASDGFRVAFLSGKMDADRLIMTIRDLGNAKHTILVVDYAMNLGDRRKLARKIKELNPTKVFGVIDRVLITFLAENYNVSYINQMLMSVMMPFSYVQPYVWDSGNVMPPEIFMGRDKELKDIESPTGVNIVYGGRQLGKSALLKMAKNDIDHDEDGRRAVYVDIKGKDYKQSAKKIGQALYDEGVLDRDFDSESWDELAREIKKRLNNEADRIPYLLLLLDEADSFIESCAGVNYSPLDALKDVQNVGTGRFKFVIAGLRNVIKFTKSALANNSVLTHLGSTTIVPFNYVEARELLEKPLYYLGLRFPKDKEALVSLILANSNYFPGLIQLYCAKLVEAMTKGDYAGYNQNDVPIYQIEQEHIKKVLSEDGFIQQVREKFEITLKLDEDNYYYIIALLMARLYHSNGYSRGYTVHDIYNEGNDYLIAKIKNVGEEKLGVFVDELCELNVFRRLADDKYVFNRYNFFQMMGTQQEIDDRLQEYMEE